MSSIRTSTGGRPRLVYVTAAFPYPLWSGYLRHYFMLRGLADTYDITLLSLTGPTFDTSHRAGIENLDRIETFARQGGRVRRVLDFGRMSRRPLGPMRALCAVVDAMASGGVVDAVFLSGKDTAAVAAVAVEHHLPLVVDLCDATSSRLAQQASDAGAAGRLTGRARVARMHRLEHFLIDSADRTAVASDRDRQALLAAHGPTSAVANAKTVPNGIDGAYWTRSAPRLGGAVAFCGNLGYPPNAGAAHRLVRSIMPLVWQDHPAAELLLIGRGAQPDLEQVAGDPRVTLTGPVADVRPYLEEAAVFAAPLRAAAGIQNKVLEAMAMEIPVVASACAAGGLDRDGSPAPITVQDRDRDLAAAIGSALLAARRDPHPDVAAGRWVREHFVWERSARTISRLLAEARAEHREPAGEVASC